VKNNCYLTDFKEKFQQYSSEEAWTYINADMARVLKLRKEPRFAAWAG